MADDNKILYTLRIEGTEQELSRLESLNNQITQLKDQIKQLEQTDKQAAERQKVQLQQTQAEYRKLQSEVRNRNKAEQEGVNTIETMRAKLSQLYAELDKTQLGTQQFKDLTQQAAALRDNLANAEAASGRFQRNVGNYAGDIAKVFGQLGLNVGQLGPLLGQAASGIRAVGTAGQGLTGVVRGLGASLSALGLPLILMAVTSIIDIAKKFPGVLDAINRGLMPIGTMLSRMVGVIEDVGKGLLAIVKGDFAKGFRQIGDAVSGVGEAMRKAYEDGRRLAELTKELRGYRLELAANEGRITRDMAEQYEIAMDVTRTDKERQAAVEKYIGLSNALLELKRREKQAELDKLKIQNAQNQTGEEGLLREAQLSSEIAALEAGARNEQRKLKLASKRLAEEAARARMKAIEEERAARRAMAAEQQATIEEGLRRALTASEQVWARVRQEPPLIRMVDEEEIDDLPNVLESVAKLIRAELDAARATTDAIKASYADRLNVLRTLLQHQVISEEQYRARKREINSGIMADTLTSLKATAVHGSKMQRVLFAFDQALAVRQALLELQKGMAKTAASAPFPANVPLIAAFAAQFVGLIAAIRAIKAPEAPKFAKGVIGLAGPGTDTSDSIHARLSRGESVMTAKATRAFAPQLAAMEMAVGNRPNVQLGNRRFAGGYIGAELPDMAQVVRSAIREVAQIPVVVSEGDITATQNKVRKIKVIGDL